MARAVALAAARAGKAARGPAVAAATVSEAIMEARARRRAVVPKQARRSAAVKAAYRMAAGNMSARIVLAPAMAQSALVVSGA